MHWSKNKKIRRFIWSMYPTLTPTWNMPVGEIFWLLPTIFQRFLSNGIVSNQRVHFTHVHTLRNSKRKLSHGSDQEISQLLILPNTCLSRNLQTGICFYTMIRTLIDVSVQKANEKSSLGLISCDKWYILKWLGLSLGDPRKRRSVKRKPFSDDSHH